MSSPVPSLLPWATAPAFVPLATAMPTPSSTTKPVAHVEYPSFYLANDGFTLMDAPARDFANALKHIHKIVFTKKPTSDPKPDSGPKPTQTRNPETQTVSAPDAYSAYFFVPGSYPLWSPWYEDPIIKYGLIYTWAQIRNKTYWALKLSGIKDFTKKHCPVSHKIGPFIWYKGMPFVFDWMQYLAMAFWSAIVCFLMGLLEKAVRAAKMASMVTKVGPWALGGVVQSTESVASSVGEAIEMVGNAGLWVIGRVFESIMYAKIPVRTLPQALLVALVVLAAFCKTLFDRINYLDLRLEAMSQTMDSQHQRAEFWKNYYLSLRDTFQGLLQTLFDRSNNASREIAGLWQLGSDVNKVLCDDRDCVINEFGLVNGRLDAHVGHIIDLKGKTTEIGARIDVIDGRLDLHRKDMLESQQVTEGRFQEVMQRFQDVAADVRMLETAVIGHDTDIRGIWDSAKAVMTYIMKTNQKFEEDFNTFDTLFDSVDADIHIIKDNAIDIEKRVLDAEEYINKLGLLAKDAEEAQIMLEKLLDALHVNVGEMYKEFKDAQTKLRTLEDCCSIYIEWCTEANNKFHTLAADIAKTNVAIGGVRNTSILHKDYILHLYQKVFPEFREEALQRYAGSVANAQADGPIQVEVALNERQQKELITMISEKMISAAFSNQTSEAGSSIVQEQQEDEDLMPPPLQTRNEDPIVDESAKDLTDQLLMELEAAQDGLPSESDTESSEYDSWATRHESTSRNNRPT